MVNTLVFVEHRDGQPRKPSLAGVTFGQQVAKAAGGALHLLVIGHRVKEVAEQLTGYGAVAVHAVDHEHFADYSTEAYTAAVVAAAKACDASIIGGAASTTTKDLLPRVAARLDAAMASDVVAVIDAATFKRPMWAGNVIATVQLTTAVKVCTARSTEFPAPASGASCRVQVQEVAVSPADLKAKFVSMKWVKSERPELAAADRIVAVGRGAKNPEGVKLVGDLADLLGAGLGASRAAVDAGWIANDLQVGQTGKVVAPDLYIAVGVSGAIQHVAGMKGSKVIVAINKDEEAPIFQVADYGLVADLFQAVPELIAALRKS